MSALPKTRQGSHDFATAVGALRGLVSDDLGRVNQTLLRALQSPVALIPEMARHLIEAGGKRLRPILTLASAGIFAYDGENHIRLAAAVELIHAATLLHDDVIDQSALRRGSRTANEIWGNKESILVGDFIFSKSFELMVQTDNIRVLQILSHASAIIAEGEVNQLATQHNIKTSIKMYLDVVRAKTAALFAAATQTGGVIAKRDSREINALYQYGLNLGIAYQIIDDTLDYAGAATALGKAPGNDFREGKMTLPAILAIAAAQRDQEYHFWDRTLSQGRIEDMDIDTAISFMRRDDILRKCIVEARHYADIAIDSLSALPETIYTHALADIAAQSVARAG